MYGAWLFDTRLSASIVKGRLRQSCAKVGRHRGAVAPGDERTVHEFAARLAVTERLAVAGENRPAGRPQDRVARRRVPFHGRSEARIYVGGAVGNRAEF